MSKALERSKKTVTVTIELNLKDFLTALWVIVRKSLDQRFRKVLENIIEGFLKNA